MESGEIAQLTILVTEGLTISMGSGATTGVGFNNALGGEQTDSVVAAVAEVEVVDIVVAGCFVLFVFHEGALVRSAQTSALTYAVGKALSTHVAGDTIRSRELLGLLVVVGAEDVVAVDDDDVSELT